MPFRFGFRKTYDIEVSDDKKKKKNRRLSGSNSEAQASSSSNPSEEENEPTITKEALSPAKYGFLQMGVSSRNE
ncbi:hypothetical protein CEXT_208761 [Caerostris extrusa]|uniref:Uncharacterized protein n=1 Tax=Caerostris extrusa TaxID=172846 RepID=A0AAV4QTI2_CAEEX|nr:hypothetical protein CEXT_208761 [Caerostris extrusa]